jgi:hypothetical protein
MKKFQITMTEKTKLQITNHKLQTNSKSKITNYKQKKKRKRKWDRSEDQPAEITNLKKTQINRTNWAVGHLLFGISVIVIWNLFVIWDL